MTDLNRLRQLAGLVNEFDFDKGNGGGGDGSGLPTPIQDFDYIVINNVTGDWEEMDAEDLVNQPKGKWTHKMRKEELSYGGMHDMAHPDDEDFEQRCEDGECWRDYPDGLLADEGWEKIK